MDAAFKFPGSSYEELVKEIKAYGGQKVGTLLSLDDVVKISGMSRTVLSRNGGFLVQCGLVSDGKKKAPTELCKKLSDAYGLGLDEKVVSIWKGILSENEFVNNMLSVINVKKEITKNNFLNHMLYSAECTSNAVARTGASTVVDIMKLVGMIDEVEGNIKLSDGQKRIGNDFLGDSSVPEILVQVEDKKEDKSEKQNQNKLFIQRYTCESGEIAELSIPIDASEDDLLGFRDLLDITLKRKFKLNNI